MKGVSAIIATILMLIITIGLAGTAYVYISGMMTTKMEKTISVLDASCNATSDGITLVVANDGTETIATADLKVYINNVQVTNVLATDLPARQTRALPNLDGAVTSGGSNTVLVVSPSNSVRQSIWCS